MRYILAILILLMAQPALADRVFLTGVQAEGDIGTDLCVRLGDKDTDANAACLCVTADAIYHDTDCDGTKDVGEENVGQASASPGVDSITTSELDDAADTPVNLDYIRINPSTTQFEYRSPAEARADIGADDASNLTSGTIPSTRVGAGHIDALTELNTALCGTNEVLLDTGGSWTCATFAAVSADAVEVEDGDELGTFSTVDTTARFSDADDINFVLLDGGAGGPDELSALIRDNVIGFANTDFVEGDATDVALGLNECTWATTGIRCEGAGPDAIETLITFPTEPTGDDTFFAVMERAGPITSIAGPGLTINATILEFDFLSIAIGAGSTSSFSGFELLGNEVALLQGCSANEILKWNDSTSVWACGADVGGAGSGDDLEVEAGDDGGTFETVDTTGRFEDSADINFARVDGGAGGPDEITGTVRPDKITTDKLSDAADTPVAGEFLRVAAIIANVVYDSIASVLVSLGFDIVNSDVICGSDPDTCWLIANGVDTDFYSCSMVDGHSMTHGSVTMESNASGTKCGMLYTVPPAGLDLDAEYFIYEDDALLISTEADTGRATKGFEIKWPGSEFKIDNTQATASIGSPGWLWAADDVSHNFSANPEFECVDTVGAITLSTTISEIVLAKDKTFRVATLNSSVTTGSLSLTYNLVSGGRDTITRGSGSFVTNGFLPGMIVQIDGTINNEGPAAGPTSIESLPSRIYSVAALTITLLQSAPALVQETVTSTVSHAAVIHGDVVHIAALDENFWAPVERVFYEPDSADGCAIAPCIEIGRVPRLALEVGDTLDFYSARCLTAAGNRVRTFPRAAGHLSTASTNMRWNGLTTNGGSRDYPLNGLVSTRGGAHLSGMRMNFALSHPQEYAVMSVSADDNQSENVILLPERISVAGLSGTEADFMVDGSGAGGTDTDNTTDGSIGAVVGVFGSAVRIANGFGVSTNSVGRCLYLNGFAFSMDGGLDACENSTQIVRNESGGSMYFKNPAREQTTNADSSHCWLSMGSNIDEDGGGEFDQMSAWYFQLLPGIDFSGANPAKFFCQRTYNGVAGTSRAGEQMVTIHGMLEETSTTFEIPDDPDFYLNLALHINEAADDGSNWGIPPSVAVSGWIQGDTNESGAERKMYSQIYEVNGLDPADSGEIRLGNTDEICWEDTEGTGEVCIQADASEIIQISNGFLDGADVAVETGHIDALAQIDGSLCGTNQILEDQGASWACIGTPAGGAEVNNLELIDPPNVLDNEVYVGSGPAAGTWIALSQCGAGSHLDFNGTAFACETDDDVPEVGDFGNLVGGDGITNTAGTLAVDLNATIDGVGLTTNLSGLEFTATAELALLQGCADNQILKWVEAASTWDCAADAGGVEVNNLETTDPPNVLDNEVYVGTGAAAGTWIAISQCGVGSHLDFTGTAFACETDDDVPEVGDFGALVGGDGITNTAGTLAADLNATADGVGLTSSLSGMEFTATAELALLQGCANNEILKWVDASSTWACAADGGGAGLWEDSVGEINPVTATNNVCNDATCSNWDLQDTGEAHFLELSLGATKDLVNPMISVSGSTLQFDLNTDGVIDARMTATGFDIDGNTTASQRMQAHEDADNGTSTFGIQPVADLTTDRTWVVPDAQLADHDLLVAGTTANTLIYSSLPDCDDAAGNHLNYDRGTHVFTCGTSSSAAATAINDIGDATGAGAVSSANFGQVWDWNTPTTATALTALELAIVHDGTTDITTQTILVLRRAADAAEAGDLETGLAIVNSDTNDPIVNAIQISSAAGGITNGLHFINANITNPIATDNADISFTELEILDAGTRTDEGLCSYETAGNQLDCELLTTVNFLAKISDEGAATTLLHGDGAWAAVNLATEVSGSLTLVGDIDGAHGANDIDELAVEAELEAVMDLADLQGAVTDAQVPDTISIINGILEFIQSAAPAPTLEGRCEWETDDDHLICGDAVASVEFVPAEDVSGDATMTDAGVLEVTQADAFETNPTDCGADTFATTIAANGDLTCEAVDGGVGGEITDGSIVGQDIADAYAGRSLTETANVLDADEELYRGEKDFIIETATTADDLRVKADGAITLVQLDCVATGATTPSAQVMTVVECTNAAATCVSSGLTVTVSALLTNVNDSAATDAAIDDGDWWGLDTTSLTTAADFMHCTVEFTRDD